MDFMIHMKYREEIADNLYAFLLYHGDCVLGQTLQARNAMWANSTFKSCRCSS
jgi:hypothetical protein